MKILRFESDLMVSNMYLIVHKKSAIVIDPFRNTAPGMDYEIDKIILTHEHYDHISGVNQWKQKYGACVLCSEACACNIGNPRKNMSRYFEAFYKLQSYAAQEGDVDIDHDYRCQADITFRDRTKFTWNGNHIELFELPGHSEGSIGVLVNDQYFFSGDSLFKQGKTELGFPGGDIKSWKTVSEKRIQSLPWGVKVYPGHYGPFVLADKENDKYGVFYE
ncbi:MAG: MBL fold metallo-hydrolase [Eubacteriales bacterium]|nr:MBL fold metallo-hydrolase [Eubacteriales bacterium]